MTLLCESLPSIVDRLPAWEARLYLRGRSDMLEAKYQALMVQRELVEASARVAEQRSAFIRSVGRVIDRAIAEDAPKVVQPDRRTGWFAERGWSMP